MSNVNNAISALDALEVAKNKLVEICKRADDSELTEKIHSEICNMTVRAGDFSKYVEELKDKH